MSVTRCTIQLFILLCVCAPTIAIAHWTGAVSSGQLDLEILDGQEATDSRLYVDNVPHATVIDAKLRVVFSHEYAGSLQVSLCWSAAHCRS